MGRLGGVRVALVGLALVCGVGGVQVEERGVGSSITYSRRLIRLRWGR